MSKLIEKMTKAVLDHKFMTSPDLDVYCITQPPVNEVEVRVMYKSANIFKAIYSDDVLIDWSFFNPFNEFNSNQMVHGHSITLKNAIADALDIPRSGND